MLFNARRDIAARQVGTDLILYDLANKDLHVLNAAAARIFQLCDGSRTLEEIARKLVESFDGVEYTQAYEDAKRTLVVLEAKHLLVPQSEAAHMRK